MCVDGACFRWFGCRKPTEKVRVDPLTASASGDLPLTHLKQAPLLPPCRKDGQPRPPFLSALHLTSCAAGQETSPHPRDADALGESTTISEHFTRVTRAHCVFRPRALLSKAHGSPLDGRSDDFATRPGASRHEQPILLLIPTLTSQPRQASVSNGTCSSALLMPSFSYIHNTRAKVKASYPPIPGHVCLLYTHPAASTPSTSRRNPPASSCAGKSSRPPGHAPILSLEAGFLLAHNVDFKLVSRYSVEYQQHSTNRCLAALSTGIATSYFLVNDTSAKDHMPTLGQ